MKVLILDNFDSFVYNLADYVGKLGHRAEVVRSVKVTLHDILELNPDRIILSPGPGHPSQRRFTGISQEVVKELSREIPILGVCLGHQVIVHAFGGKIVKAKRIMHGKTSPVKHNGEGVFKGLRNPLIAGRYHSLVVDGENLPECFEITARSLDDDEVMAVRHKETPLVGLQFHPESILTEDGIEIIRNFLEGEI
ncbi:MAG: aminodeoxychorismate/anthranilate synthase component II [Aigarchaeota archaeon]|nr:aminodeoxychorismate/anthranilate synthase component II [Aigarchaeota archaeon]